MTDRMIRANGIELATQACGDAAQAPVFLIMGAIVLSCCPRHLLGLRASSVAG
jgi:hypothetical protein